MLEKIRRRIRALREALHAAAECRALAHQPGGLLAIAPSMRASAWRRTFSLGPFQPEAWARRAEHTAALRLNAIVASGFRQDAGGWLWQWDDFILRLPRGEKRECDVIVNDLREVCFEAVYARHFPFGRAVADGDVILDCGANIGAFAIWAAKQGPRVQVHAFEPEPENFATLVRNVELNGLCSQITCHQVGLGDREQRLAVQRCPAGFTMHTLGGADAAGVRVATIDQMRRELGLNRCNMIKMDIEGAERVALAGAKDTLTQLAPCLSIAAYHLASDPFVLPLIVKRANVRYHVIVSADGHLFAFGPT
ncbi:MAG: FkbM family methyltransferase [Opitutaceae bacterium]|nr:FkbM family methyltransferase [Opitutaceae bacterium]